MKKNNMKLLTGLCNLCLALGLVVQTTRVSLIFFGEPDFPVEE